MLVLKNTPQCEPCSELTTPLQLLVAAKKTTAAALKNKKRQFVLQGIILLDLMR